MFYGDILMNLAIVIWITLMAAFAMNDIESWINRKADEK